MDVNSADGSLEEPKDAGPNEEGEIKRWLMEIDLASKTERDWHHAADSAIKRYRRERKYDKKDTKDDWQFNIFWANVDVLRPHLYGATPKADVRRRFRDPDPIGKAASEIMERALDYHIDTSDFDGVMSNVILDYLIPSRGVARVRFEPVTEPIPGEDGPMMDENGPMEQLTGAKTYIERVSWDRFKRGPGTTWEEVPWVAYEHQLIKAEIKEKFPGMESLVNYDVTMEGVTDEAAAVEPNVFKRVRVWEVWDKTKKEILWIAPSYKQQFLLREDDKLKLEGFFDCERPLYAVESGTSLVPLVEYDMYRSQARELDNVTLRINKLISTLKQRGIYDATVTEFKRLFSASDNEMIPTEAANTAMQAGGLDKAVWLMPIEQAANVLQILTQQRDQIKATIYEMTGISDILRGQGDPNETLGAQQLKAATGGLRIQRRQRDVQRFIRGMIRRMAEIIAQNYTPELLSQMTGIQLPTAEQKMQAQMQMQQQMQMMMQQQMQQQPQQGQPGQPPQQPLQPDPKLQKLLQTPSWDDVMKVLKSDLLRSYRIDIETDSTISVDQASERQQVTELITGIGSFIQNIGPAVQNGQISGETAKSILIAAMRRFKFGRVVEDAIEQDEGNPPPQKPDPEMMKMQAQGQMEQQKMQAQMQLEQFKVENQAKLAQATQQAQAQQDSLAQQQQAEREKQKLQMEHEAEMQKMLLDHKMDMEQIQAQHAAKLQEIEANKQAAIHAKVADQDHQLRIAGMKTPDQADAEVNQVAEAIKHLANTTAETHQGFMQHAVASHQDLASKLDNHANALGQMAKAMAAPRKAIRDKSGRLIGSAVEITE